METKVLCVDDEPSILKLLSRLLEKNGFSHRTSNNPVDAKALFPVFKPDIVLMDIMMPGISGNELLVHFMGQNSRCKIIMLTAHPSAANVHHALQAGAFDFIEKPFKIEYLLNCIVRARERMIAEEEHMSLQNELETGTAAMRELMNFKTEFLTRLFHDLKPPTLNAMMVWRKLEMYTDDELTPLARKMIDRACEATSQFQVILDNLVEISILESGRQTLDWRTLDVNDVVGDISRRLEEYRKKLAIELIVKPAVGKALVNGDMRRSHLIFENIILNAIQFTPPGGTVTVEVTHVNRQDMPMVKTTVTDTGIGITQEDVHKIFQSGYRIKRTSPHGLQGAGLGLAIVRDLVKLHAGKISVSSSVGKGTSVSVFLPAFSPDAVVVQNTTGGTT